MEHKLVDITSLSLDIEVDIVYATDRNFTGKPVYKKPLALLHPHAADLFVKATDLAKALGLRFKVFDAYRPHEAQWALWKHTPDPEFLSHPETGSMPHCRGVAIDLTLIGRDGKELDMGTPFDSFQPLSHHGKVNGLSVSAQKNRLLLLGLMTSAGWDFYRNEWWHYQCFKSREFPLLSEKKLGLGMI